MHDCNLNQCLTQMCVYVVYFSRRALANALAAAPSMWTLGNAGMGALQVGDYKLLWEALLTGNIAAFFSHWQCWCLWFLLQRLAEDSNPVIAAAASKAIYELKKQWEIEEGDSWMFMMDENTMGEKGSRESDNEDSKWEIFGSWNFALYSTIASLVY